MRCKSPAEIGRVYVEGEIVTPYPAGLLGIFIRDTKSPPFIVYKAIERNFPFRAEIEREFLRHREDPGGIHTVKTVLIIGDAVDRPVIRTVLFFTPPQGFIV